MHVSSALNAIKTRGTFKAYKGAHQAYVEQRKAAKEAKANMSLFTTTASEGKKAKKGTEKTSKEASGKNRSEKEKASQKTKEGAAPSNASAPELCKEYKAIYKKAILAKETAKNQKDAAVTKMFQFYANLLSLDAKYAWNKIVREQMDMDTYKDLKGVSRKGSRGLCGSHLTTALCSTFSQCFRTMQQSKKSITFPMFSRSLCELAYASLYSA
jgi:hypothetical protein